MTTLQLFQSSSYACGYLPDSVAQNLITAPSTALTPAIYSSLIDVGFRRSGETVLRPNCADCTQCISLRLPTKDFIPSKSQRRVMNINSDLEVNAVVNPDYLQYYSLYSNYIQTKHPTSENMQSAEDTFNHFFQSSWAQSFVFEFRQSNQELICIAICDPLRQGLSAVYTFYDSNQARRSLGTFSILKQIEYAQKNKLDYLYLGYWIQDCARMNYKTKFRPCEGYKNEQWVEINE